MQARKLLCIELQFSCGEKEISHLDVGNDSQPPPPEQTTGASSIVGYTLTLREASLIELRNDSTTTQITGFEFSVGDTSYFFDEVRNFDAFVDTGATLNSTVLSPSPNTQGDLLSPTDDLFLLSFVGFDPFDEVRFLADVDLDGTNSYVPDFESYFDNGLPPNSTATVTFSNGQLLAFTYPENSGGTDSRVIVSQSAPAIPEPSSALLFVIGVTMVARAMQRRSAATS